MEQHLTACDLCPRDCGVDRTAGRLGFCLSGWDAAVASYCDHHGEEPALSGTKGSGTIFFGNCSMRCVFCQNHQISQPGPKQKFQDLKSDELAGCMLYLQDVKGCHNINLVSPTHFVPQIVRALTLAAARGLKVPLVYNTNGYDSVEILRLLHGIIDIYLPDLKYASDEDSVEYSRTPGYVQHARRAIKEMFRQVGALATDGQGVATRGLIIRHLVLPNGISGSPESLEWVASELAPEVTVSLMSQYAPNYRVDEFPLLSRRISVREYAEAVQTLDDLGMQNGWVQDHDSSDYYLPDFEREGHPFEAGATPWNPS